MQVFVDIVEQIWATVGPDGTVVRSNVNGEITLHCFLPESPSVSIKLNTDLSGNPSQGKLNQQKKSCKHLQISLSNL